MIRLFPVIVETDLTDRHDLPGLCQHTEFGKFFLVKLRRAAGMNTGRAVDKGISLRQFNGGLCALHIGTHIDNRSDPACCQTGKQRLPVLIKCLIIIMGVCVKYHITYISPFPFKNVSIFLLQDGSHLTSDISRFLRPPAYPSRWSSETACLLHPLHRESCPQTGYLPASPVSGLSQP